MAQSPQKVTFVKVIFFSNLGLPTLSLEDTKLLDSPITLEELLKAIKATNRGCTPGIDGIPVELYLGYIYG